MARPRPGRRGRCGAGSPPTGATRLRRAEAGRLAVRQLANPRAIDWLLDRNEAHRRQVGYRGPTRRFLGQLATAAREAARARPAPGLRAGRAGRRHHDPAPRRAAPPTRSATSPPRGRELRATHLLLWHAIGGPDPQAGALARPRRHRHRPLPWHRPLQARHGRRGRDAARDVPDRRRAARPSRPGTRLSTMREQRGDGARLASIRCRVRRCIPSRWAVWVTLRPHCWNRRWMYSHSIAVEPQRQVRDRRLLGRRAGERLDQLLGHRRLGEVVRRTGPHRDDHGREAGMPGQHDDAHRLVARAQLADQRRCRSRRACAARSPHGANRVVAAAASAASAVAAQRHREAVGWPGCGAGARGTRRPGRPGARLGPAWRRRPLREQLVRSQALPIGRQPAASLARRARHARDPQEIGRAGDAERHAGGDRDQIVGAGQPVGIGRSSAAWSTISATCSASAVCTA